MPAPAVGEAAMQLLGLFGKGGKGTAALEALDAVKKGVNAVSKAIDALKNSIYRNNSARHNMLYHKQIFHKNSKSSMLLPLDFYNNSPNNSILQKYSTLTNNIYSSPIKKKLFNNHSNTKSNKSTPNLYIRKVVSFIKPFSSIN
jgi:hypothetical protein